MEKWRKDRKIEREIERKKKEQESAEAISGLKNTNHLCSIKAPAINAKPCIVLLLVKEVNVVKYLNACKIFEETVRTFCNKLWIFPLVPFFIYYCTFHLLWLHQAKFTFPKVQDLHLPV